MLPTITGSDPRSGVGGRQRDQSRSRLQARERIMPHPIVVYCAALTIDAALKSAAVDDRLAASGAEDMELLATSREAIAYSENLLARLKRQGK